MNKLMSAISILFMVMLINSSSAVSAIEVDISSGSSFVVEDESGASGLFSIELLNGSAGGSYSVEDGPDSGAGGSFSVEGGPDSVAGGSFMIEWLGGSAGSVCKFSQWEYLFH